jgi:hypothetical protein
MGLLCHHLKSLSELLVSTTTSSSVDSEEEDGGWAGADFSRLNDLEALCRFLDSSNYFLEDFGSDTKESPTRMRANTPRSVLQPMP